MSIFVYTRVSSKVQGNQGVGLESQLEQIKQYINNQLFGNFVKIQQIITEVGSASHPEKLTKLNNLIDHVCSITNSTIIVHAYDRFSRNVCWALNQIQKLKNAGCNVISITEPLQYNIPSGYHQLVTIFNNAELDSRNKGLKIKHSIAYKKSLGGFTSKAPFGFKLVNDDEQKIKRLAIDEREQKIIEIIKGMRDTTFTITSWNNFVFPLLKNEDRIGIEFDCDEDGNILEPGFDCIAQVLNDYKLLNKDKLWSAITVKGVYNRLSVNEQLKSGCDPILLNGINNITFHEDEESKYDEEEKSNEIEETDDEDVPFLQYVKVGKSSKRKRI